MTVTLTTLAGLCGPEATVTGGDTEITGVGLDSTNLPGTGALFAALPGTRTHGAAFAADTTAAAILTDAAGARLLADAHETRPVLTVPDVRAVLGLIAAEVYGHPTTKLHVIGITGTSGKTTTSYLVEGGLRAAGHRVAVIGTTGTRIDGRPVPTSLTTPEAPTLQQLFARMLDEGVTHVVMEVSSHALALRRVLGTRFEVAGFTNLSQDHLDFHPTMADYFAAKALLFDAASPMHAARAVVCVDDEWGRKMAAVAPDTLTVSTRGEPADVSARDIAVHADGSQSFTLAGGFGTLDIELPLPGRFNVANAALATALVERLPGSPGVDLAAFTAGIAGVAVPGRMERIDAGQDFIAVVDYAHKPAAVGEVLRTLRGQVTGRIGIVIGAGGNRDTAKREIMGAKAAEGADLVIVTDDNPRDEDPALIRAAVLAGARQAAGEDTRIEEHASRREAIERLIAWARPGDAVVVAGKGHEVGQLIAGVNHHFDDREEVRRALGTQSPKEQQ